MDLCTFTGLSVRFVAGQYGAEKGLGDSMSDATADGDSAGGQDGGGKGKMIKLAGAGGGAVVILLAVIYFFAGGPSNTSTTAKIGEDIEGAKAVVFFDVPEMTVNLATSGTKQQYLKLKVSLELPYAAMSTRVEEVMPRVLDTFQVYLRELRADDLKGSAGMFRLKDELRKRVNTAVAPA